MLKLKKVVLLLGACGVGFISSAWISPSFATPSTNASSQTAKKVVKAKSTQKVVKRRVVRKRWRAPSVAMQAGLRKTEDLLDLKSSVAYILDQDTGEELFTKNADVALPIASVTKLMTALVIAESGLPMAKKVKMSRADYVKSFATSKLRAGMWVTRESLLSAALMSSDNRAAQALARTYPGGLKVFIKKMNEKAVELGMDDSHFADPTGLRNENHATARDLAKLVSAVSEHQMIRNASTTAFKRIKAGRYVLRMHTTNRLIGDPRWKKIGVQKTGYTSAAGRCMVVQSEVADRRVVMVVLDSPNSSQRAQDMQVMRKFVELDHRSADIFEKSVPYELL